MSTPNVGDTVQYVPELCHELDRNSEGKFAWSHKWQQRNGQVVDVTDEEVVTLLKTVIKSRPILRENLTAVKPQVSWPATVVSVNEDGSLNLKMDHPTLRGVSLEYPNIPEDESDKGETPHSWFVK